MSAYSEHSDDTYLCRLVCRLSHRTRGGSVSFSWHVAVDRALPKKPSSDTNINVIVGLASWIVNIGSDRGLFRDCPMLSSYSSGRCGLGRAGFGVDMGRRSAYDCWVCLDGWGVVLMVGWDHGGGVLRTRGSHAGSGLRERRTVGPWHRRSRDTERKRHRSPWWSLRVWRPAFVLSVILLLLVAGLVRERHGPNGPGQALSAGLQWVTWGRFVPDIWLDLIVLTIALVSIRSIWLAFVAFRTNSPIEVRPLDNATRNQESIRTGLTWRSVITLPSLGFTKFRQFRGTRNPIG